jgi:uncharacterized protein
MPHDKLERLRDIIKEMGSILVAFSGGADSAFLAKVAHDLLGERVVAATAFSPSFPSYEREKVVAVAREIGLKHVTVETGELKNPDYRANRGDRCFFCKTELYDFLAPLARESHLMTIANGTNIDDLSDLRPGLRAAEGKGIRSPLVEAGLNKMEIRTLSREMGLSTHDKPAMACLSSRIPVGTEVTPERLARIDRIESGLLGLGFKVFRVRFHEPIARIEVGPDEVPLFFEPKIREEVTRLCHENGFKYAALDLSPISR